MSCEERRDRILHAVVDEMAPVELDELRAHLAAGCDECERALAEARVLERDLGLVLDPVEPPLELRAGVLAIPEEAPAPSPGAARGLHRFEVAALAAGVGALLVGLGLALGVLRPLAAVRDDLRGQLEEVRRERDALLEQVADLETEVDESQEAFDELDDLEVAIGDLRRQIEIVTEPGVEVVTLQGSDAQPDASAQVYWDDDYYCYFRARQLEHPGEGRTYALWLDLEDGDTILAGTSSEATGIGDVTIWSQLPRQLPRIVAVYVTDEPEGDADPETPTGTVHLRGEGQPAG